MTSLLKILIGAYVLWFIKFAPLSIYPPDPNTAAPPVAVASPGPLQPATATQTAFLSPQPTSLMESKPVQAYSSDPSRKPNKPFTLLEFAQKALDPQAFVASVDTRFFTSACFGQDANLLQDADYVTQDVVGNKCQFGYQVSPATKLPQRHYPVANVNGEMRFYVVPPDAFSQNGTNIKVLAGFHLIVPLTEGCAGLGTIGLTADGYTYATSACAFRPGVKLTSTDGLKTIVLPTNPLITFDPNGNGGAYGFAGFPAVTFRNGFSLYYTGKDGYAPTRTYFEAEVDTLSASVQTTAETANVELAQMQKVYDDSLQRSDPKAAVAAAGKKANWTSGQPITGRSKDRISLSFEAPPDSRLAGVVWHLLPLNHRDPSDKNRSKLLETNLQLTVNGQVIEFTGVEDLAHCAFYGVCTTGWSGLYPTSSMGYTVVRNFPFPVVLTDRRIVMSAVIPDNGTVLEMSGDVIYR